MSRLVTVAFTSALLLSSGHLSTAEAQLLGSNKPLAVPITGSVVGGGSFVGTLSIQRFAVQGSATVAVAMIAGTIVNVPGMEGATGGMRANISLPVTVNAAVPVAYRRREFGAGRARPRAVRRRREHPDRCRQPRRRDGRPGVAESRRDRRRPQHGQPDRRPRMPGARSARQSDDARRRAEPAARSARRAQWLGWRIAVVAAGSRFGGC